MFVLVAYWSVRGFAEFSLNAWKKKIKICRFLQTGSVLGVLLSVWPVHLLPDCMGVKGQPDVKAYDFLMSFLSMCPAQSIWVALQIRWYVQELFRAVTSSCISFSSFFLTRLFHLSLVPEPLVIPYPRWLWIIYLPLNALDKPRSSQKLVCPEKVLRWVKKRQNCDAVHQITTKQVKTHNHRSLRIKSILLPLASVNCTRNVGHCLHGCHLAREWDMVGA